MPKAILSTLGGGTNGIEAKWSVLERCAKKYNGCRLPCDGDPAEWDRWVKLCYAWQILAEGESLDGGSTRFIPVRKFL